MTLPGLATLSGAPAALAVAGGVIVVTAVVSDAVSTLVVTQGRSGLWRPTRLWYAATWRLARAAAARLPSAAGEMVLNVYPALSLLGLLVLWLVALDVGWALVYLGLGDRVPGGSDFGNLLYYAGTSLLTPAFGTARSGAARVLSLVEALSGLGTIALLISYLPALYGAYSRRESRLLTLDDPSGLRLTPVRLVALHSGAGDAEVLHRFFADWESWVADVLESHVSYPMLALFRSQHAGQSWVTALGVVTDAATLVCACVEGAEQREPYFLHRRGRRAVVEIADRLHVPSAPALDWLTQDNFEAAWGQLERTGLPLRDKDEAWARLRELRAAYGSRLEELIDFLVAPRGFWGHSAEATVEEEVARAGAEARRRGRRPRRGAPGASGGGG